jgi:predicted TIM-barrel fold metal-dependent hydrolase
VRVDAHCHLFNGRYAFREALAIGWDYARGTYPHREARTRRTLALPSQDLSAGWQERLQFMAGLFAVLKGSCDANYDLELAEFAASGMGTHPLVVVPLMMDIYYIFADDTPPPDQPLFERFHAHAETLIDTVLLHLIARLGRRGGTEAEKAETLAQARAQMQALTAAFEADLHASVGEMLANMGTPSPVDFAGMPVSWGYRTHLEELLALQTAHPARVFPFLAVDPRRPRVLDFVTRGRVRATGAKVLDPQQGPCYGVKLYPPLGYLPDDPRLHPLYAYCVAHDIPITAHCQPGALHNPRGTQERDGVYFSDPRNWQPVLARYPALRLNLAHFGGLESVRAFAADEQHPDGAWTRAIVALLEYPNVYTDLSAFTDPAAADALATLIARHPVVARKLLFGTDYVISMLHIDLEGQLREHFDRFTDLPHDALADNALRFLNVQALTGVVR